MIPRPDLLPDGEKDLEVFQLTSEEVPSSHVYMEAQIFTPDSNRLVLHRSAHPHGSDPADPEHRFLVCDLEDDGALWAITDEPGTTGPSISPDGQWLYYFVNETRPGGGRLTLKRVGLDGAGRETIVVVDGPLPGTDYRPSRPYPLSTISSDGQRIAISAFLGNGNAEAAPWGLLVFHIEEGRVDLVVEGPSWCNMHPQYSRSLDSRQGHDILIQENHGNQCDANGVCARLTGGAGADIHVVQDDGSDFRDMPWGRDGNEFCQGHQCWRGRGERAITSTGTREPAESQLIEGLAAAHGGHAGIATPGGLRNDLSRSVPSPDFYHFATDIEGELLITDSGPTDSGGGLHLARLPVAERGALEDVRYLLSPGSSWQKETHIHPFLSPDGRTGFFNSDENGLLQAYMVMGW